jgi:hypothetical protein
VIRQLQIRAADQHPFFAHTGGDGPPSRLGPHAIDARLLGTELRGRSSGRAVNRNSLERPLARNARACDVDGHVASDMGMNAASRAAGPARSGLASRSTL